ncbi:MAG: phosphosulfolactate synthase [Candidatus Caldarchaeales archaeon]
MVEKAFGFISIRDLPRKPRDIGLTEIRGPYYSPVTLGYLRDLLDDWGEYIDGFKFAGGSQRLLSRDLVKKIIRLCHDYDVYVSTGGFIERVIIQGSEAVDRYLEECKTLEFDVVEVSSGLAPISLEDKIKIVKEVRRLGMKPKPEISIIMGAGAGVHQVKYEEQIVARDLDEVRVEAEKHLDAGAYMLMLESEGITEGLPPEKWRTDVVRELVKIFGHSRWMFEAAEPEVFKWYLKNIGEDVNLFIDHSQIVELTAWRTKLWGDRDIWRGKKITYNPRKF